VTLLLIAGGATSIQAAETRWWVTNRASDHQKSEARGVIVRTDGALELGPAATSETIDSLTSIWAVQRLKDGSVALAGDRGTILRWSAGRGVTPWVKLPVGQVLSLAADGDGVIAGTGPEGVIYRIGAKGDTTLLSRTGERYVWGLAPAGKGAWYAATGTHGRLLRIAGGKSTVVLDSEESNLVSVLADGKGGAFIGGDSQGRVMQVRADGSARTLFDAPEDEIRGLALGRDGALYAAALSSPGVTTTAPASEDEDDEDAPAGGASARPAPVSRPPAGGGRALVYRMVSDSSVALHWTSPQPILYALAVTKDGLVAASGNRAGIFSISEPQRATQWLAPPQGQVTALAVEADGRVLAGTSNPAALWRLGPGRATRGELISQVLDARRLSRWGRGLWRGESGGGSVRIETRSGNTEAPDTTWSAFDRLEGNGDTGGRIASPPGRYLQWKLVLEGGSPRVESVEISSREANLAPVIEEVAVSPQGQGFRDGDLTPRAEPITQTLPSGQRVEYSLPPVSSARPIRELPSWARGVRTIQWKASDPNGDPLIYRVDVGSPAGNDWREVVEDLDVTTFSWDTQSLPDGRYRVRVAASDETVNPWGEERTQQLVSEPFTVDNTAPEILKLGVTVHGREIRVEGEARDASSTLTRIELSIDEDPGRPVTPEGGFTDRSRLTFSAAAPGNEPGPHAVKVIVVDAAGNSVTRVARAVVPER